MIHAGIRANRIGFHHNKRMKAATKRRMRKIGSMRSWSNMAAPAVAAPCPSVTREAGSLGGFAYARAPYGVRETAAASSRFRQLQGLLFALLEVELAAAEDGQVSDEEEVALAGHIDVG